MGGTMTKQTIATIFFRDGANYNFNILRVLLTLLLSTCYRLPNCLYWIEDGGHHGLNRTVEAMVWGWYRDACSVLEITVGSCDCPVLPQPDLGLFSRVSFPITWCFKTSCKRRSIRTAPRSPLTSVGVDRLFKNTWQWDVLAISSYSSWVS